MRTQAFQGTFEIENEEPLGPVRLPIAKRPRRTWSFPVTFKADKMQWEAFYRALGRRRGIGDE